MKDWTGNANSIYKTLGASNHTEDERQSEDFYSTQKQTVLSLLNKLKEYDINLSNNIMIEPAVGSGNILKACFETNEGYNKYLAYDIVDRGFPNTKVADFLTVSKEEMPAETKTIITNPPYSLAKEFVEHSMDLLDNDEYCIMLLKIQFLEGKARKELFKKYPPKFVWVFSERQKCLKNDKDTGGSSAVCYCWFIWQKGFNGKPLIDWL